jgi:hypothetical protein
MKAKLKGALSPFFGVEFLLSLFKFRQFSIDVSSVALYGRA